MISAPGLLSLHQYFYIFIVALVILGVLGIFIGDLYKRLSVRTIALIFVSGPITVIITRILNDLFIGARPAVHFHLLAVIFIVLSGPVILGLLAALLVRKPLRQFDGAIDSLEQSNYRVQLQPTGIYEFDEIFTKFNDLIKRLQHEEKLRKDLVSDTSHELNTPLTAMIGQLTAMQEGKHSVTKARIDTLKQQAERLAELVQQLDAYTKARAPSNNELEDIPLRQLCKQLINQFDVELKQKGIVATLHITDDFIVHASRDALQRILTNFIQNAIRYSEATEIIITVTTRQLMFSDNGKGVPTESLPFLFERFYRVDKSRSRAAGGLGLGLSIVKELVEQQGWHIHVKAARPGITFVIDL